MTPEEVRKMDLLLEVYRTCNLYLRIHDFYGKNWTQEVEDDSKLKARRAIEKYEHTSGFLSKEARARKDAGMQETRHLADLGEELVENLEEKLEELREKVSTIRGWADSLEDLWFM